MSHMHDEIMLCDSLKAWDLGHMRECSARILGRKAAHPRALLASAYCRAASGDFLGAARDAAKSCAATAPGGRSASAIAYLGGVTAATRYYAEAGEVALAAAWHDSKLAIGSGIRGMPRELPTGDQVWLWGTLGELVFQVTRLPPGVEFAESSRGAGETTLGVSGYLSRLRPSMERAGYRLAPLRTPASFPATTAVRRFGVERPLEQLGFLEADPEAVTKYRQLEFPRPWIGVTWTGGQKPENTDHRSIGPAELVPALLDLPGTLVDLQHETREQHAEPARAMREAFAQAGRPLRRLPGFDPVGGLDDALGALAALDCAVSADNSTPYLLAALGVPVYVLLPAETYPINALWGGHWRTAIEIRATSKGWGEALREFRRLYAQS